MKITADDDEVSSVRALPHTGRQLVDYVSKNLAVTPEGLVRWELAPSMSHWNRSTGARGWSLVC